MAQEPGGEDAVYDSCCERGEVPMSGLSVVDSRTAAATPVVCAEDLQSAIWHEFAVLANIEAGYCSSCEWLERWQGPESIKKALATQHEVRRRMVREPHVLHIASLHQRLVWS